MKEEIINYQALIGRIGTWIQFMVALWKNERYKECRQFSDLVKPIIAEVLKLGKR